MSVIHPHTITRMITEPNVGPLRAPSRSARAPMSRASRRLPTVSMPTAYTTPPTTASSAIMGSFLTTARSTANNTQDTTSSEAPQASANVPSDVPANRRSTMIRASIGNAVMATADAVNSITCQSAICGTKNVPGRLTSSTATALPRITGTVVPAADTDIALRTRCRISPCRSRPRRGTCTGPARPG